MVGDSVDVAADGVVLSGDSLAVRVTDESPCLPRRFPRCNRGRRVQQQRNQVVTVKGDRVAIVEGVESRGALNSIRPA
jgi:hypothetical protein